MTLHQLVRTRSRMNRRSAFTLLEVLVVVAILVVLASVASIYVFRYLDDAKKDSAKLKAAAIQKAVKAYIIKYDSVPPNTMALINPGQGEKPFLEGGADAIKTPWGGEFAISSQQRGDSNEVAIIVSWQDGDGQQHQIP